MGSSLLVPGRCLRAIVAIVVLVTTAIVVKIPPAWGADPITHMLAVALDGSGGGDVRSDDGAIDCPAASCDATFDEGAVVVLRATAAGDSQFTGWGGDCAVFGTAPCTITVDSDRSISATFDLLPPPRTFALTVTTSGTPGFVVSDDGSIDCPDACSAEFDEGTTVTLDTFADEGSIFRGWGGDCSSAATDTCTITMDADHDVTARFASETADFQLLVTPAFQTIPAGGSVAFDVGIGMFGGFSDPVSLSVSGLPTGVTGAFSANPLTSSGISVLTLTAAPDAPAASAPITITASGGGISHVATGSTRVDIGLTPLPPSCSGSVQGVVTNSETGQPIADTRIFINRGPTHYSSTPFDASTIGTGAYSIPMEIFHAASRTFIIGAAHYGADGHLDDYWWAEPVGRTVACGQQVTANFTLVPDHGAQGVTGRIVEGIPDPSDYSRVIPTTTPIEDAVVRVNFAEGCFFSPGIIGFARYCAAPPRATSGVDGSFTIGRFPVNHNNADKRSSLDAFVESTSYRTGYWDSQTCRGPCGFLDLGTVQQSQATLTGKQIALVPKCTGSIEGVVYDRDGNRAPAGVEIRAGSITDFAETTTGVNGTFSFPALLLGENNAPIDYNLSITREDVDGSTADTTAHFGQCGAHPTAELRLHVGYASVQGTVYDDADVQVEGAEVSFWNVGHCYPLPLHNCTATTGPGNGSYRIGNLAFTNVGESGELLMVASKTGYWDAFEDVSMTSTRDGTPASTRDFILVKKHYVTVSGTVHDLITGEPIPNACSRELSPPDGPLTCTDATGHFTSAPLELGQDNEPLNICYEFEAEGHFPVEGCVTLDEAAPEPPLVIRQAPLCDDATVTGRVFDTVTQRGIPNAEVTVFGVQSPAPRTQTGPDGTFVLEHVRVGSSSPVETDVFAQAEGYQSRFVTATLFCGATIDVTSTPSPSLVVAKSTVGTVGSFGFESTGGLPSPADSTGNFAISTSGSNPNQVAFLELANGQTYRVIEPSVAGWDLTGISCSGATSSSVMYGSGSSFTHASWTPGDRGFQVVPAADEHVTCTFENTKRASITVTKYRDTDRDGQPATGDPGLAGWTFFIDTDGDATRDPNEVFGSTDATGRTRFTNLLPGSSYRVCEVISPGWVNTDPGSNAEPCKASPALTPAQDAELVFGNATAVSSSGSRTIGFWRNKNGQTIITKNCLGADGTAGTSDDLRTYLRGLLPFQDLSTTATCSQIASYTTSTIDAATKRKINDPSNMNAMMKAQMLATALDTYFSAAALGGNKLGATQPIGGLSIDLLHMCKMIDNASGSSLCVDIEDARPAFNGQASMTVAQMLSWAASRATAATSSNPLASPWYGQNRTLQRLAKDSFDSINNGVAFASGP